MIEAIELTKSFGAIPAVRGVSFRVNRGEAIGFLGPNGAGKTTTFRMIAGTLGASSGRIRLIDRELGEDPLGVKRNVGYMPENAPLYPELTGREYLRYRAELKGVPRREREGAVARAAELSEARSMLGMRIGHLSRGYRQRMALADALVGDPPVLLLDEPTSGLDPNQVLEVRQLIRKLAENHAILLSTHVLSEVEATCSRAIVLHEGRVVAQGTLEELHNLRTIKRGKIVVGAPSDKLAHCLAPLFSTEKDLFFSASAGTSTNRSTVEFPLESEETLARAIALCCASDLPVLEAKRLRGELNDVFAQLTAGRGTKSTDESPSELTTEPEQ